MMKFRILTLFTLCLSLTDTVHAQQCTNGFQMDRSTGECLDIDECRTIADACRGDMMCVNQNGGYLCIPRTNTLYRSQYRNPFLPGASPLSPPLTASSFPSPARPIVCRFGYHMDENSQCADIDECASESHQCNPTQVCINTEGGYTCSCTEGYWLLEGQCLDIDECRYGYCQQLCANVPGSYSCTCNLGFLLNSDGRSCQGILEVTVEFCAPWTVSLIEPGDSACACSLLTSSGQMRNCSDVDECTTESPCIQNCVNTYGSYLCRCDPGYELEEDGTNCNDMDECSVSEFLCQHECVNEPGSYYCSCPSGYVLLDDSRTCQDIDECDTGNNTCTTQQTCLNIPGTYKCLDPVRCDEPYIQLNDNRCMCPVENPTCRDQPFTIVFRHMDIVSSSRVPVDIFQMQATSRYPGVYYIFQIKSGNEGREFYMRQTGPISATLVMTRPIKGPRDLVLDLEMISVNTVVNFRGSSIIRLRVFVSPYSF